MSSVLGETDPVGGGHAHVDLEEADPARVLVHVHFQVVLRDADPVGVIVDILVHLHVLLRETGSLHVLLEPDQVGGLLVGLEGDREHAWTEGVVSHEDGHVVSAGLPVRRCGGQLDGTFV